MTSKRRKLVAWIRSAAFCDNGAMIRVRDILAALDTDRGAGHTDPTEAEVDLLVMGDRKGRIPTKLRRAHPALDALLQREMT